MDPVFVVFEDYKLVEIFSTEDKAKDYIKQQKEEYNGRYYHYEEKEVK